MVLADILSVIALLAVLYFLYKVLWKHLFGFDTGAVTGPKATASNGLPERPAGRTCCTNCNQDWLQVKPHETRYGLNLTCYPICEDCWDKLGDPEARIPVYKAWFHTGDTMPPAKLAMWDQLHAAVRSGR